MSTKPTQRRKQARKRLSLAAAVKGPRDTVLGDVVDLSPGGLRLRSDAPLDDDDLDLRLAFADVDVEPLQISARRRWSGQDLDRYVSGLEITDINADDLDVIQQVLEKYGTPI